MSGFRDFEQTLFSRIIGLSVAVLVTVSLSAPLLAQEGMRKSPDGDGWISINKPHRYADVFLDSDRFTGAYTLAPQVADIGRTAKLVVVAHVNDRWYPHDGAAWQLWNSARMADLRTFAGDYTIFAGYQVGDGPLVYNDKPLQFSVQSKKQRCTAVVQVRCEHGSLSEGGAAERRQPAGHVLLHGGNVGCWDNGPHYWQHL